MKETLPTTEEFAIVAAVAFGELDFEWDKENGLKTCLTLNRAFSSSVNDIARQDKKV